MRFWTWSEIKEKVQRDLDLEDETFITPDELLGYANEAIDEAEGEIHSLYEGYFRARSTVTLVSGTEGYALPTSIYAAKILRVFYRNGSTVYPVTRIPESKMLEAYETAQAAGDTGVAQYQYFLENSTAGSPQMVFVPTPNESGAFVTVWHIRNANRLTADADLCDIPEFINFVLQHMKVRCYEKEGHPNLLKAVQDLETERSRMTSTLSQMVADGQNEIEADFSHYREHV